MKMKEFEPRVRPPDSLLSSIIISKGSNEKTANLSLFFRCNINEP